MRQAVLVEHRFGRIAPHVRGAHLLNAQADAPVSSVRAEITSARSTKQNAVAIRAAKAVAKILGGELTPSRLMAAAP